jgi:diguanylate cyclase (GGDEF)-like protein/PAS domain S-box-containing protein
MLVERSPESIAVHRDNRLIYANPATVKMFGAALAQDLVGKPVLELVHKDFHDLVLERLKSATETGDAAPLIEARYLKLDGTSFDVEVQGVPIRFAGEPAIQVSFRDVSERRRTERALRLSEDVFRKAFEHSPDSMNINRLDDGMYVSINRGFSKTMGYTADEIVGHTSAKFDIWVDPNDRVRLVDGLKTEGFITDLEANFRAKDGTVRCGLMSAVVVDIENVAHVLNITRDISKRKKLEADILVAKRKLEATLAAIPDLLFEVDIEGRIYDYHTHRADLLAVPPAQFLGKRFSDFLPEAAAAVCLSALREAAEVGWSIGATYSLVLAQGERWFELSVAPVPEGGALEQRFIFLARDVSERSRVEQELRIAAVAFGSQNGMMITDHRGTILRVNAAFTRLTGYTAEESIGQTSKMLHSGRQDETFYQKMWAFLERDGFWQGEIWNRRKDGRIYAEMLNITAVLTPGRGITHYVGSFTDITKDKESEAEIHRLAYYDALTRLPNRRLLQDRLGQALAATARSKRYGAMFFIDLDNFKALNDSRGHDIGDALLVEVAERLRCEVREGDTVARQGGDEFVVLMEELSADIDEAIALARQLGEKLRFANDQPFNLRGYEYHGKVSIGVSLFNAQDTVEELFKHADLALYQAKSHGRNTLRFFDPAMQAALDLRSAMEVELREALKCGQLQLYYQPQVHATQGVMGVEALLRWQHPERGMVLPDHFIALAEDSGLILPIGLWVLETACAQLKKWELHEHARHLHVAVNVSARQFRQPDFSSLVKDVLFASGAKPSLLKLELTESLVLESVPEAIDKMRAIKELGVTFSLDDFGTGYSSLCSLVQIPVDQLKIDLSFVKNIPGKSGDEIIAKTIISMGQGLAMSVLAEGVESQAQREFLEVNGCQNFQGTLFSEPLAIDEFEAYLAHA